MPKTNKRAVISVGAAVRDIFLFLKPTDVSVLDNPDQDLTCKKLLALEYGAKIHAAASKLAFGGGALNSSITFSRQGLTTEAITALGCDDTGEAIIRLLERENVNHDSISYHSRGQTGFSVLVVDKATGEHVALVERGANDLFKFSARAHKLSAAPWCYLTSLTGEHWQASMDKIISTVKNNQIKLAWNPGNEQLERGWGLFGRYLKHCALLILNRDEALGLLQSDGEENNDVNHILNSLLHWGVKMVIVTDGPEGAYYADKHQKFHIATSSDVKVVDSTGAGDAFGSGFVSGLIATKMGNIAYALQVAMANAESVISQIGAQAGIVQAKDLDKILKKKRYKIRKI